MQLSLQCPLPSISTQRQQHRYAFSTAMTTMGYPVMQKLLSALINS
ncbi:MAG: hypothetical protein V7L27_05175 [Nostoc sp.]